MAVFAPSDLAEVQCIILQTVVTVIIIRGVLWEFGHGSGQVVCYGTTKSTL